MDKDRLSRNSIQSSKKSYLANLKVGIWFLGNSVWAFGIGNRAVAFLADGKLSALDFIQLSTTSFFLVGWLFLKPNWKLDR
jgi:hypothetical protein